MKVNFSLQKKFQNPWGCYLTRHATVLGGDENSRLKTGYSALLSPVPLKVKFSLCSKLHRKHLQCTVSVHTPLRNPRISGLKSEILKPSFLS